MLASIKYNLANLTNFNGRDARQTFWYYVLFLVVLQFAVGIVMAIPLYIDMFGQAFEAAQRGVGQEEMQAAMFSNMAGQMKNQMLVSSVVSIIVVLLLLASFVRRLHDSGKPGWWAAVPAATYTFAAIYNFVAIDKMIAMMEKGMVSGDPSANLAISGWSSVSWLGILVVIVFGVMKSDDGPNKYGDAPVRF